MPVTKIKKYVFPKRIGSCVDRLEKLRDQIKAHAAAAKTGEDKLKAEEAALLEHMRISFKKERIEGADGRNKHAVMSTDEIPIVEDWEKLYKYVKRTGQFDLIQKRLSTAAVRERRAAGKVVPGTGTFNKVSFSLTKKK